MMDATVCKSECGTWVVVAFVKKNNAYCIIYEGIRKKDCRTYMKEHQNEFE